MKKKIHKRILSLLVMLAVGICTLGAVSWSTGISLGLRDTSLYDYVISPAITAEVGDFEMGVNFGSGTWIDAGAYYNGHAGKTFRYEIGTGLHQVYSNGGMWALTFDCGQEFILADHWILKYMIGSQFGLSWSPYSPENVQISQSPYIELEAGYRSDVFTGKIYVTGEKMFERTWQSLPIIGSYLSLEVADGHEIYLDTYFKLGDYMKEPDIIISSTEIRLGYRYKGGER